MEKPFSFVFSQLQYRNKNQIFISNFAFQCIKKERNGALGTRIMIPLEKNFFSNYCRENI